MAEAALTGDVRQALYELQRYFSDQVAPLMMVESMETLLAHPPEVVASEIQHWAAWHVQGGGESYPVSDYYFHALKKIQMMSEYELLDSALLTKYIGTLMRLIVSICPEAERNELIHNLRMLGKAAPGLAPVGLLHRQTGSGAAGAAAGAPAVVLGGSPDLRRFSLLLSRLGSVGGQGLAAAPGAPQAAMAIPAGAMPGAAVPAAAALPAEVLSSLLIAAAAGARRPGELDALLRQIGEAGADVRTEQAFRALAKSLPEWSAENGWEEAIAGTLGASHPLETMHRIVAAAEDPAEGARRFNEMLQAAIERFNEGSLAQASSMFDLAERILSERRIPQETSNSIRRRAHSGLSEEKLRTYADKPARHSQLRRVLNFFPALSSQGLLESLFQGEPRRDRRKLALALLEVHGASARTAALGELERVASGAIEDPRGYFLRNLVYLLRRIPRVSEEPVEKELDLLIPLSRPGNSLLVAKEVIWTLGQMAHPRAEAALMRRLEDYEDLLTQAKPGENPTELLGLLDRTVSTLARFGSAACRRAVVQHALSGKAAFGDPIARIEELAGQDLSPDRDLVELLVESIREQLPRKMLGLVVQKDGKSLVHLLRAVAGTTAPAVRQLLEEIVTRFPSDEFARVASESLAALGATSRPAEAPAKVLSGDMELFGLPHLFQTLSMSKLTGTLTLADTEERIFATLSFEEGQVVRCENGPLRGEPAFYQLFEKPIPGVFAFRSAPVERDAAARGADASAEEPVIEVLPAVLEALRRYDELQQARSLVPDDAPIKPASAKPTRPEEEQDSGFLRSLWARVSAGATAAECEAAVPEDAYRIRRMLAHWLEEGALQLATAGKV